MGSLSLITVLRTGCCQVSRHQDVHRPEAHSRHSILLLSTGIGLKEIYDYINGAYLVVFTLDRQFPATPYGVYMLDAVLNGAPIAGSPFALRVEPGPVHGPNCEISNLTADDVSALTSSVNKQLSFEVVARDIYGNRQIYSDTPENWAIEVVVVKGAATGQGTIIKVQALALHLGL